MRLKRTKVRRKAICKKHRWETAGNGKALRWWQIQDNPHAKTYCVRCGVVAR